MTTMKKRNLGRMVALAAVLCLITTCLLGGTLAQYTSTVIGEDSATVAKFAFAAKTGEVNYTETNAVAINIFGDDDIQPGQKGNFNVLIDNTGSEVKVNVDSTVTVTNTEAINLKYFIGTSAPVEDTGYNIDSTGLAAALKTAIDGTLNVGDTDKEVKVFWKWVDSNVADTALGKVGTAQTTINISITGTQDQTGL